MTEQIHDQVREHYAQAAPAVLDSRRSESAPRVERADLPTAACECCEGCICCEGCGCC